MWEGIAGIVKENKNLISKALNLRKVLHDLEEEAGHVNGSTKSMT